MLFFLYPRFSSSPIDPILFQITLTTIVLTISSFGFSGIYYYGLVSVSEMITTRKGAYLRRADLLFVLGRLFRVSEPALILFTVGLAAVGSIASSLWLLFTYFVLRQARELSSRYWKCSENPSS